MNNATYPAKITGLRRQHLFFALCWTAYFSTYIGRLNFTASLAAISAAAGFSQSELGLVSSGFLSDTVFSSSSGDLPATGWTPCAWCFPVCCAPAC